MQKQVLRKFQIEVLFFTIESKFGEATWYMEFQNSRNLILLSFVHLGQWRRLYSCLAAIFMS